ncbi:MAG: DUF2721 domain-containing protein [Candidatus Eisenbacteria bacterium]|nr:DUF2721 domain-containing protein [Candidatus Eisenbacteria bacterium]
MHLIGIDELTRVLQLSISPVALISGVGLLLLSMTNRLARTIDTIRELSNEMDTATPLQAENITLQIRIIYKRSRLLQASITLASVSVLCTGMIVFCLFAIYALHARLYVLVLWLWGVGLSALVASLALFVHDVTLSLAALKHEVGNVVGGLHGRPF